MSKIVKGQKATNIEEIKKIADVMNISVDELVHHESETNVIEDPILFMMNQTENAKIRHHLQYLDYVMDEMIELEELKKQGASTVTKISFLTEPEMEEIELKANGKLNELHKTSRILGKEVFSIIRKEAILLQSPFSDEELCAFVCQKRVVYLFI